jgi:hypothetical protein
MPDGHHRRGFVRGWPVGQGDAVDIGFESERIEADFAKREGLVQVVLHPLRTLCPHEVGHEIEPGQRIGAHQQDQRGQSPDKLVQHRLGTKNRHNVPRLHRSRAFLHIGRFHKDRGRTSHQGCGFDASGNLRGDTFPYLAGPVLLKGLLYNHLQSLLVPFPAESAHFRWSGAL